MGRNVIHPTAKRCWWDGGRMLELSKSSSVRLRPLFSASTNRHVAPDMMNLYREALDLYLKSTAFPSRGKKFNCYISDTPYGWKIWWELNLADCSTWLCKKNLIWQFPMIIRSMSQRSWHHVKCMLKQTYAAAVNCSTIQRETKHFGDGADF